MKQKMPLVEARAIAEYVVKKLEPCCLRIEIAGSIRRGKFEVGDIEIVAEPLCTFDLFGEPTYEPHMLDEIDYSDFGQLIKGGHKYKQIAMRSINLDLFIVVPPAQWGVIFAIRTGPAEYSHRLVTQKRFGGLLPSNMQVKDGAIWCNGKMYETPEEADVYQLIGVPYLQPGARK